MCVCVCAAMLTEADGCKYLYMYQQQKNLNLTWRSSHSEIDKLSQLIIYRSLIESLKYVSGVKILTHTQIMRYNVSLSFSLLKN